MVITSIQHHTINLIEEAKWQRYNKMVEQYRVMENPRIPRRRRVMRAGGRFFIDLGERLERSACIQPCGEMGISRSH